MNSLIKVSVLIVVLTSLVAPRPALGDGKRVGVLTVSYSVNGNGSYSSSDAVETDSDQNERSYGGEARFAVLQTEGDTKVTPGNLLSSTFNANISGSGFQSVSFNGFYDSWTYQSNPNQTNGCFWLTNQEILTNQTSYYTNAFFFVAELNVLASVEGLMTNVEEFGTWGYASAEVKIAIQNLYAPFELTNAGASSSQAFHENCTQDYGPSAFASATLTATLDYAPDELTVPFTVTSTNGTAPMTVQVVPDGFDSSGAPVRDWLWDFGDGKIDADRNPTHAYVKPGSYVISLTCTNTLGLAGAGEQTYTVHVAQPFFTVDHTNGPAPLTVNFTCPTFNNGKSPVTDWEWDFGDGNGSQEQNPIHTYNEVGDYEVTLKLMNADEEAAVAAGPTNISVENPTIQISAKPTIGFIPMPVAFTCPEEDSTGTPIVGWYWSFDDGSTSTEPNPTHIYGGRESNQFSPSLTATNSLGIEVHGSGPTITVLYPPLRFTATPTNGQVPLNVQFSAPTNDALAVPIKSYLWNFGDGVLSTLQQPSHTYTNAGVFAPVLLATNTNNTAVNGAGPSICVGCLQLYTCGSGTNGDTFTNYGGSHPQASLILGDDRFYGVMSSGGSGGSGTIFALNLDGTGFTNLHDFGPVWMYTNLDGAGPDQPLALAGNTLYGTCSFGGWNLDPIMMMSGGTLFRINTNGSGFTNLFNFGNDNDGAGPNGVIMSGNTLFGTTRSGGSGSSGTIFKIGADGSGLVILHTFSPQVYNGMGLFTNADGALPSAPLTAAMDDRAGLTLYGTTTQGGQGAGTIFRLAADGSGFTVLQTFSGNNGWDCDGPLTLAGNTLYGTTSFGGNAGDGIVFKINKDGSGFIKLHDFGSGPLIDGAQPSGGLLLVGSLLYGTTQSGGCRGSGTIFAVDTNGLGFSNLYSFSALAYNGGLGLSTNLDGANPYGEPILVNKMLCTTACFGGSVGDGALFALSLAPSVPPLIIQPSTSKSMVISWPSSETGWTLQQSADLADPDGWSISTLPVSDDGANKSVTLQPSGETQFFRLKK